MTIKYNLSLFYLFRDNEIMSLEQSFSHFLDFGHWTLQLHSGAKFCIIFANHRKNLLDLYIKQSLKEVLSKMVEQQCWTFRVLHPTKFSLIFRCKSWRKTKKTVIPNAAVDDILRESSQSKIYVPLQRITNMLIKWKIFDKVNIYISKLLQATIIWFKVSDRNIDFCSDKKRCNKSFYTVLIC